MSYSYPHHGTSPLDAFLINERLHKRSANIEEASQVEPGENDERQSLLSSSRNLPSRRSSVASRYLQPGTSIRSRHNSRHSHFGRFIITPLSAPGHHDDDRLSTRDSFALDDTEDDVCSTMEEEEDHIQARLKARGSFSSAFRNVFGGNAFTEIRATAPSIKESVLYDQDAVSEVHHKTIAGHAVEHKDSYANEFKTLLTYTLPLLGTQLAQYSLLATSVIIVGRLDVISLASASLGSMTCNVIAFCPIQGMCSALESLCPAAFASSQPKLSSLYALRTFILTLAFMLPQLVLFWTSESILLALKQEPDVAAKASLYLKIMGFSLPAYSTYECIKKWLQGQGKFYVPAGIVFVVAPLNILITWLLVLGPIDQIRLGYAGAPLAIVISTYLMAIFALIYSIFFLSKEAWGGFDGRIFQSLGLNLRLGLAGTCMIGSEWLCWELVAFSTSYISPVALAAQSVLGVICSFAYQIPYAISTSAAVRVANLIGGGHAVTASKSAKVGAMLAVVAGSVEAALLAIFRSYIPKLFTQDSGVIVLAATVLPIIALFQIADGVTSVMSGILRGAGRPHIGAIVNVSAYYLIGLPIGFALTFSKLDWGLVGLWIGLTCALAWTSILMTAYVFRINFQKEVDKVRERFGTETSTHSYGTIPH